MTTGHTRREARQLLRFPNPGSFASFLMTCLDVRELAPGSEVHEKYLNRIFIPRSGAQVLHVTVRSEADLVDQITHMAIANGAETSTDIRLDAAKFHVFDIQRLLRSIRLQPMEADKALPPHLLVALWQADPATLGEFLKQVWDLGAQSGEVAFVRVGREKETPSHFVRIQGLRHVEAFQAWCQSLRTRNELYIPLRGERRMAKFYVAWGYRHPVPEIQRLVGLDRELVLLRPMRKGTRTVTEWVSFQAGEVNFFRKAYEFGDMEVELDEVPMMEVAEKIEPQHVPLEITLVPKPRTGPNRIWQIDRQIDRQRHVLHDLELQRARLANNEQDEVYFAYRFDQPDENLLNARLARLMQQRLSTLNQYDYAYCQPRRGKPYHLVIANQSQRQLGFALQPADRIYYQPVAWRRWGLNLFLPIHEELAPRVDSVDVLPLLQRILERSDVESEIVTEGEPSENGRLFDCAAVLWDMGREGVIDETRVLQTSSLLAQFRLLNKFQREMARHVDEGTQVRLGRQIQNARSTADLKLDEVARELWQHVAQRTSELSERYKELGEQLNAAEKLIEVAIPRVDQVKSMILDLPKDWATFVKAVMSLQRKLVTPELDALGDIRGLLEVQRDDLRGLAANGRDLVETARRHQEHLHGQLAEFTRCADEGKKQDQDLQQTARRLTRVMHEIAHMHQQLRERIEKAQRSESRATQMQSDIDHIETRERDVQQLLSAVEKRFAEVQTQVQHIQTLEKDVEARQDVLIKRSVELARKREELKERAKQLSQQLAHIEVQLVDSSSLGKSMDQASEQLNEQFQLVEAHANAVALWDQQRKHWQQHLVDQQESDQRRMEQVRAALDHLMNHDHLTSAARGHLSHADEQLSKAEKLMQQMPGENNGAEPK